jgi:hypothetical protein
VIAVEKGRSYLKMKTIIAIDISKCIYSYLLMPTVFNLNPAHLNNLTLELRT